VSEIADANMQKVATVSDVDVKGYALNFRSQTLT
jgi:hypothetical protein